MDQMPRNDEGYSDNNNLFAANSQQYNAYDNLFPAGPDQSSYDNGWGINASTFPAQSRAQNAAAPSWPQNANHLSVPPAHAAGLDARALSHSPVPYAQNAYGGYLGQQAFQYHQPHYDPALVPASHAFNQNFNYSTPADFHVPNAGTIAPHALQQDQRSPSFNSHQYHAQPYQPTQFAPLRPSKTSATEIVDQAKLLSAIPRGSNGGLFSIINFDDLIKATTSERMGNFVTVGTHAQNWDVNRAALPPYIPRKSRNDLRKQAADDPKLLARLSKTGGKRERALAAASKPAPGPIKAPSSSGEKIKYEGDQRSEEESSSSESDDESAYTSDEDAEVSPLPEKRPDTPKGATEYDTIRALWRGKRKPLPQDSIRKGLGDFWEIVKTIRDRWKADVAAAQDAEAKNRTNELPLLRSRVKDQRDMLETAFKAALKHGHRGILELMSENLSLLYLCYQFLLDRSKVDDYNSALPRVMLETISLSTTITAQKLEQTHMVKVLPRYLKKGDAKTQYYARRITTGAAAASKEINDDQAAKKTPGKESSASSPASKKAELEPVAGVKRSASTAAGDGQAQKKMATGAYKPSGPPTAARPNATAKRVATPSEGAKAASSTSTAPTKSKQAVAKPSGLFSSLQSAAKKPGTSTASKAAQQSGFATVAKANEKAATIIPTAAPRAAPTSTFSFAETMANLSKPKEQKSVLKTEKQVPQETPEEKAKRLRKESRRHLRVSFKPPEDLVEVREFDHDSDEELGHDANQVRDVGDVGGEGRMFKQQHQMMDIDDEDEVPEDIKLVEFQCPAAIDFSTIDVEERKRNYARFGGLDLRPESTERSVREAHEANTLIVFYADAKDIPSNPREPSDPSNGETVSSVKSFGLPEEKWGTRAKRNNAANRQQPAPQNTFAPGFDLSKLTNAAAHPQQYLPQTIFQPPVQAPILNNDSISNILASLQQAQTNHAKAPAPVTGAFGSTFPPPHPTTNAIPIQPLATVPSGQPDLAAILAQIQQNQTNPPQSAPVAGFNFNALSAVTALQPQTQQSATTFENPERKQWREGGGNSNNNKPSSGQNPWFRTKVCKYWQEGRCQKGDACSYKHEES